VPHGLKRLRESCLRLQLLVPFLKSRDEIRPIP
jgi:hypothetical protein